MNTEGWFSEGRITAEGQAAFRKLCLTHYNRQTYRVQYGEILNMGIPKAELDRGLRWLYEDGLLQKSSASVDSSYYLRKEHRPKKA